MRMFESSVNPEGIQTECWPFCDITPFESSINPEGIQTFMKDMLLKGELR